LTFEQDFSINAGMSAGSKNDTMKWISVLNSYRNSLAHEGTKEKGLNRDEVTFLENIYNKFVLKERA
jgi:DNA sulfur modification protein DndB